MVKEYYLTPIQKLINKYDEENRQQKEEEYRKDYGIGEVENPNLRVLEDRLRKLKNERFNPSYNRAEHDQTDIDILDINILDLENQIRRLN